MELDRVHSVYFIGIGGIGMSALARYFNAIGKNVEGYDKTPSNLTDKLQEEGISIHFDDLGDQLTRKFDKQSTIVIYTPAVPADFGELVAFHAAGFVMMKRAQMLGYITQHTKGIGVAGTHGKTTTSTMLAHVLHQSVGCNAFLGGISTNYGTNLIINKASDLSVVEADEFDRSFLQLHPFGGVLTAVDADHLDIYKDANALLESFTLYINRIDENGFLLVHASIDLPSKCRQISYGIDLDCAIRGGNLRYDSGKFLLDIRVHNEEWLDVELGVPGIHNAENALAVVGVCLELGLNKRQIVDGLASFKGVKRRFEYIIKRADKVYIDDYAHHPTEINALLASIRLLYPTKRILGVFQPHLFSRTRDFLDDFAKALSELDDVVLLPIYPARELPIEGVTSDVLVNDITSSAKQVLLPTQAIEYAASSSCEVILTIGAGDIDRIVEPLKSRLS